MSEKCNVLARPDYKIINYIDLCCGIGGFRVALESFQKKNTNIRFNCVLSADIKDDAIKTYNLNFNENNKKTNILSIEDINSFDLLCAGFPCQPFSSAGNKKGFSDDRGGIIFKIIDICKKYKPKIVILENVSNLIILEDGKPLKKICEEFNNIDYFVSYKKLNATDFGVPQNRERVFIVCSLEKIVDLDKIEYVNQDNTLNSIIDYTAKYTDIETNFANKIIELHLQTPLFGYKMQDKRGGKNNIHSWDIGVNGVLTINERGLMKKIMTERRKKHWAKNKNIVWMDGMPLTLSEISTFVDYPELKQMLDNLVVKKYLRLEKPKKLVSGKRVYDETGELGYNICKGKLSFPITNILDPNATSPTLTATDSNKLAVIIDNTFIRKLNDNELKLLCGFPLSYKLPGDVDKYDLFGNMVIPNVVEGVLKCIF
jgi:DNA (cytosine-5)-methyltransferase 1